MKGICTASALLLLALLLVPRSSAQQAGTSGTMPKELLQGMLTGGGNPAPQVLVGTLPDYLPDDFYLPNDARLVGSLLFGEEGNLIVAVVEEPPEEAVAEYRRVMSDRGWSSNTQAGFRGDARSTEAQLCKGSVALYVSAAERGAEGTFLQIRNTENSRLACGGAGASQAGRSHEEQKTSLEEQRAALPLPAFRPPDEAEFLTGGSDVSGGGRNIGIRVEESAVLESDLSASALVAHYADQLRAIGWQLAAESGTEGMASQSWRFEDAKYRLHGTLLAVELPGTSKQEVFFHATDPTTPSE